MHASTVPGSRIHTLFLAIFLCLFYLALQVPYWVPASDSDVYISVARNVFLGHGLIFNGLPAIKIPPLWPLVLSWAFEFSASFWFLNGMVMLLMVGFILIWHRILVRLVGLWEATAACAVTGVLFCTYRLTFLLYSDPLFLVCFSLAVLFALQSGQQDRFGWRSVAAIVLTCLSICVRWAGLLCAPIVVGSLLSCVDGWGGIKRRVPAIVLTCMSMAVTFLVIQRTLAHLVVDVDVSGYSAIESTLAESQPVSLDVVTRYIRHLSCAGYGLCWLFYPPLELGLSLPVLLHATNLAGWLLIALYVVSIHKAAAPRRAIWIGALAYASAMLALWSRSNTRYLLPVVPMLVVGIWRGLWHIAVEKAKGKRRHIGIAICVLVASSVVLTNLALYAASVKVARSGNFYGAYHAGQCRELVGITAWLRANTPPEEIVAVSPSYVNVSWRRANTFGLRAVSMLTGNRVRMAPEDRYSMSDQGPVMEWLQEMDIRYFVDRPEVSPWRVWHYRAPRLQELLTGESVATTNEFFELYCVQSNRLRKVECELSGCFPTSVPLRRERK